MRSTSSNSWLAGRIPRSTLLAPVYCGCETSVLLSLMRILPLLSILAILPASGLATTISTTFASNNSFAGNMFDVSNLSATDVTILGTFQVNLSTGATGANMSVYYRAGSYVGFQNSSAGWTLLGTDFGVNSAGLNVGTPIDVGNSFNIGAGQTYGFYVTITNYTGAYFLHYTNGANTYTDGVLQITTGIGKGNPDFTGTTFTPRTWNGSLDYVQVPEPTTMMLLGIGLSVLAVKSRRRN
jgi:PEP-CTERM motif